MGGKSNNSLSNWVQACSAKGISKEAVKKHLEENGFNETQINELLLDYGVQKVTRQNQVTSPSEQEKSAEQTKPVAQPNPEPVNQAESIPKETKSDDKKEEKKDPKEYDRDSDAFSPDDFKKLENKETSLLKKLFKKKEKDDGKNNEDSEDDGPEYTIKQLSKEFNKLQKKVEKESVDNGKRDGKLDIFNQKIDKLNDGFEMISEKVGEVRSSMLSKERLYNKLEDDISQIKYITQGFKPEILENKFNEIDRQFEMMSSRFEKDELYQKKMDTMLQKYTALMEQIKDFENLVKKLKNIKEVETHISSLKNKIDTTASRIDVLVQHAQQTIGKINNAYDTAESNKQELKEINVTLAKIDSEIDNSVKKTDFEAIKSEMFILKKVLFDKNYKEKKK